MQNPSFFARKGVFAGETFSGFPPLFYKSRRRRAICNANRKCSKKKHHPSGWCFFLSGVDRKDALQKIPVMIWYFLTTMLPTFFFTIFYTKCAITLLNIMSSKFFPENTPLHISVNQSTSLDGSLPCNKRSISAILV